MIDELRVDVYDDLITRDRGLRIGYGQRVGTTLTNYTLNCLIRVRGIEHDVGALVGGDLRQIPRDIGRDPQGLPLGKGENAQARAAEGRVCGRKAVATTEHAPKDADRQGDHLSTARKHDRELSSRAVMSQAAQMAPRHSAGKSDIYVTQRMWFGASRDLSGHVGGWVASRENETRQYGLTPENYSGIAT